MKTPGLGKTHGASCREPNTNLLWVMGKTWSVSWSLLNFHGCHPAYISEGNVKCWWEEENWKLLFMVKWGWALVVEEEEFWLLHRWCISLTLLFQVDFHNNMDFHNSMEAFCWSKEDHTGSKWLGDHPAMVNFRISSKQPVWKPAERAAVLGKICITLTKLFRWWEAQLGNPWLPGQEGCRSHFHTVYGKKTMDGLSGPMSPLSSGPIIPLPSLMSWPNGAIALSFAPACGHI